MWEVPPRAYHLTEHLLHKDNVVLTTYFRRFWDMQDPWVDEYLTDKVIGTLKKIWIWLYENRL